MKSRFLKMISLLILYALCALAQLTEQARVAETQSQVACLDDQGNAVDWYIGYKFPKVSGAKVDPRLKSGSAYAYITSKDAAKNDHNNKASSRWVLSDLLITDEESILLRTIKAAYNKKTNVVMYNDGVQTEEDNTEQSRRRSWNFWYKLIKAHAKGVLMVDEKGQQGVWLTHSIPKFPNKPDEPVEYPKNGRIYGQTFMCITFDLDQSGKGIVDHLNKMRPKVYDRRVSERLLKKLPQLRQLIKVDDLDNPEDPYEAPGDSRLAQKITTKGGQELLLFSKSKRFNKDIYAHWIDAELKSSLYVETWRRGKGSPINSTCPDNGLHTNNIAKLMFSESINWPYLNDHSKWAISDEKEHGYVCIGDSNRMESQFKRGGGAVCIKCPYCWSVFSSTILEVEPCNVASSVASE